MSSRNDLLDLLANLDAIEAVQPSLRPQPKNKPQNAAFLSTADIVLYGGSAFGGKSVWALMMALYKSQNPVIFRRQLPQHNGLIRFANIHFPGRWKGNPPVFHPTAEDRKRGVLCNQIRLAHLDHESQLDAEQGVDKTTAIFDEAVQFPWAWINRIAAHIRSNDKEDLERKGLKCQLLLTFNPPLNPTGLWILEILAPWNDPSHPLYPTAYGEVLYMCYRGDRFHFFRSGDPLEFDPVDNSRQSPPIQLKSITFFKAMPTDNEAFDSAYLATLQNLSDVERRALLDGEMTASLVDQAGQIVKRSNWIAAVKRWEQTPAPTTPPVVVSIDIADGGDDYFVCMPFWKYGYAGMPHSTQGKNVSSIKLQVEYVEAYLFDVLHTTPEATALIVDVGGGYGSGFVEKWIEKYPAAQVVEFQGGSTPGINAIFGGSMETPTIGEISGMPLMSGSVGFLYKSHAAWVRAGQMLEHPLFQVACPPDKRLEKEATSRKIEERSSDKIVIESKEKIRDRLGHSPDFADAWVMGLWYLSVELAVREMF